MKKLPTWSQVNQDFYGLRDMIKGQSFVHVDRSCWMDSSTSRAADRNRTVGGRASTACRRAA